MRNYIVLLMIFCSTAVAVQKINFADIAGLIATAQLPTPTTSNIGAVKAINSVSHEWINSVATNGSEGLSQPSFSDILNIATVAQTTIATQALTTCTTARTIDWSTGNVFTLTLTNSDACTLSFSGATSGQTITIWLSQPASTGSATVVWPTAKWFPAGAPTMTTGGSALDVCTCNSNGASYGCNCLQNGG